MRRLAGGSIDVAEVRRAHPIHEVVAASGVELQPRGHGFVGCCPFHEDVTPSLSVGGVPDRFHCFGCGASGDVIDYVRRRFDLGFVEAVEYLAEWRAQAIQGSCSGTTATAGPPHNQPRAGLRDQ